MLKNFIYSKMGENMKKLLVLVLFTSLTLFAQDGIIDTTFDSDGIVETALCLGTDKGYSVAVQTDGEILLAGGYDNGSNDDIVVVRYSNPSSTPVELTSFTAVSPSIQQPLC